MDRTIGLLGGGQLGQMLCEAANPLGIQIIVLDAHDAPAKQVNARNAHINGSFKDPEKIRELARRCDILTVEIEHVDTTILEEIAVYGVDVVVDGRVVKKKVEVQPSWKTLRLIQDKHLQKEYLRKNGVAVVEAMDVEATVQGLKAVGAKLGYPFMLKSRKDAYDGRGNFVVSALGEEQQALDVLKNRELYAEKWAKFKMELAVMVVKTSDGLHEIGSTIAYPAVHTIHEDSVCKLVYAPAPVSLELQEKAQRLAREAASSLWGKGVFGVELFLMADDSLLCNEIAPRCHNSAHYTIEACPTMSQFKAHLLSILRLMPSSYEQQIPLSVGAAVMLNILGGTHPDSHELLLARALSTNNSAIHMYGKTPKPGRKIGHVTIIGSDMTKVQQDIQPLIAEADRIYADRKLPPQTTKQPSTAAIQQRSLVTGPLVAITMGSDSDLPILKPGIALLRTFSIPYLITITSAHRTPSRMMSFAQTAASKGIRVIIAAAGGAAPLPGMIAASTPLPVIGVPIKGSTLDGMDSLLSIVQMPRGVPVATVAINNSINAVLLAVRILGASDEEIRRKMEAYMREMEEAVLGKVEVLNDVGWENYGEELDKKT